MMLEGNATLTGPIRSLGRPAQTPDVGSFRSLDADIGRQTKSEILPPIQVRVTGTP